jgi:threonine dehydrogenase-like Zn-dependent dehydrogenase
MYEPGDVRVEERDAPRIERPTDAMIRVTARCVCGSGLCVPSAGRVRLARADGP